MCNIFVVLQSTTPTAIAFHLKRGRSSEQATEQSERYFFVDQTNLTIPIISVIIVISHTTMDNIASTYNQQPMKITFMSSPHRSYLLLQQELQSELLDLMKLSLSCQAIGTDSFHNCDGRVSLLDNPLGIVG